MRVSASLLHKFLSDHHNPQNAEMRMSMLKFCTFKFFLILVFFFSCGLSRRAEMTLKLLVVSWFLLLPFFTDLFGNFRLRNFVI